MPRNNTIWTSAQSEGWEFVPDPNNPNNYTINSIIFDSTFTNIAPSQLQYSIDAGLNYQIDSIFYGLNPDTFNIYVSNGTCIDSSIVIIDQPTALSSNISLTSQNQLVSSVSGGNPPYNYYWQLNNQFLSSASFILNPQNGQYTLTVGDVNGCFDTTYYFYTNVSLNEVNDIQFQVYPNPSDMEVILSVNQKGDYLYNIISYDGNVILKGEMYNEKKVDISHLASGLYFVQVSGDKINKVIKLMVK